MEGRGQKKKKQSGQLVLEYILLLIVAVSMAVLAQNLLVGGTQDDIENAGILSRITYGITMAIANDTPDN